MGTVQRDRPLGAALRVVARHLGLAVAGVTVFGLIVLGFLLVALYPDPPERQADIHAAMEPLPGGSLGAAASEAGYAGGVLALVVVVWAIKVSYDAYQAYRYPELARR